MTSTIRVGTLNLRNTADRWSERYPMLIEQLSDLEPDLLGLQELRRPSCQGRKIERGANRGRQPDDPLYRLYRAYKTGIRRTWEGLAVLTELPVLETERHDLHGGNRIAQRIRVRLPSGATLDFYNTHLHHKEGESHLRERQAGQLLDWLAERDEIPHVLVGDLNAQPDEAPIQMIKASGMLRSAFEDRHGREPDYTSPTPLNRSSTEPEKVLDYIFVSPHIEVIDAWITFDVPHPEDQYLTPSDHYGLAATIALGQ